MLKVNDQRDRTLRVLVATPVGEGGRGGIDRMMQALQQQLVAAGRDDVEVSFAATRGEGSILWSPAYLARFCWQMFRQRPDVVHLNLASHGSTWRKVIVARLARQLGIPYVLHLHGGSYPEFWAAAPAFLAARIQAMFDHAAQIIVLGGVWERFVRERAPKAQGRILVLPNATARPQLPHKGGGDQVHILFLGRLNDLKGVPQLGEALYRMRDLPGWRATLAGDGGVELARTRRQEMGLTDRVEIPGWVDNKRVAELIAEADVLVLPSLTENLPMSVIEGMASGLAVVATPVGAVEDIVADGETGLLVPPGDVEALTAALTRVVEDAELRARLGRNAEAFHRQRLDIAPYAGAMVEAWRYAAR